MYTEAVRREQARFYTEYAEELREKFRRGYLQELTPYPQFVVWRGRLVERKPVDLPYNPKSFQLAELSTPQSFGTLDQALKTLSTGYYNGLGFVLTKDDPFACLDLKRCVHANRFIDQWAKEIIDSLQTHTHYSPRGDGVHLLFEIDKARFKGDNRTLDKVEFIREDRLLTLTPNLVSGTPKAIEKRDIEAAMLYYQHLVPIEGVSLRKLSPAAK